jgi:hypothetical protein
MSTDNLLTIKDFQEGLKKAKDGVQKKPGLRKAGRFQEGTGAKPQRHQSRYSVFGGPITDSNGRHFPWSQFIQPSNYQCNQTNSK